MRVTETPPCLFRQLVHAESPPRSAHSGEFTLTCHLQPGSVQVEIGQRVKAGQVLGRVGEQGILHFNLMNGREWLKADGLPALFSDVERVPPVGEIRKINKGNPVTGWMIRPTAGDRN